MPITNDFVTIDSCDATTGWGIGGDAAAVALENVNFKEGSGALNLGKSGATVVSFYYEKTFAAFDLGVSLANSLPRLLCMWIWTANQAALSKLKTMRVYLYDAAGNYVYQNFPLGIGWNSWASQWGNGINNGTSYFQDGVSATPPDRSAIVRVRIYFETNNATDTIASGDIKVDYIHLGKKIILDNATYVYADV